MGMPFPSSGRKAAGAAQPTHWPSAPALRRSQGRGRGRPASEGTKRLSFEAGLQARFEAIQSVIWPLGMAPTLVSTGLPS